MLHNLRHRSKPRVLIVTPEITYLPSGMGNMAHRLRARAGGMADVSASLVSALFDQGVDVHVALPHYRRMFNIEVGRLINEELRVYKSILPNSRIHLAQDRIFYYRQEVYSNYSGESHKIALAFQREVINNIMPRVEPDVIHCNDWMTGLIPAVARRLGIPSLFTVHNIHTHKVTLAEIEEIGIDAAEFWYHLYFEKEPLNYEAARSTDPVDLLASGIFASHFVNTVSPTFLNEVCDGWHSFVPDPVRSELAHKRSAECGVGILNAPDPGFDPGTDKHLELQYSAKNHVEGKRTNKIRFQERLGLNIDENAPLFYWPSRLDPIQKGCQLLTDILYDVVSSYWDSDLQLAVVADGPYQQHFHDIVRQHDFHGRVAVCDFDDSLAHLGYAASDFMLMPSRFEPCGLPQMIGSIYGSLPVVHDTGGLHDTVTHLDLENETGNGFVFQFYDSRGLRWAIDQAVAFHWMPPKVKARQIARIMAESKKRFTHSVTAASYIETYERMLDRPLVKPEATRTAN